MISEEKEKNEKTRVKKERKEVCTVIAHSSTAVWMWQTHRYPDENTGACGTRSVMTSCASMMFAGTIGVSIGQRTKPALMFSGTSPLTTMRTLSPE